MILMLWCGLINAMAGGLDFLKNEKFININISYSEAIIAGFEEADILSFEQDWEKDQPRLYAKFHEYFCRAMKDKLIGGKISKANYTLEVRPLDIKRNGDMKAYFVIIDKQGVEKFRSKSYNAEGGRFGSFLNLVGDGMQSLGKKTASLLKKNLK